MNVEYEDISGINLTDPLFWHCLGRQSCDACLSTEDKLPCVWCPFSSACLPSSNPEAPLLLAPFYDKDDNMCPLGYRERWEVRTRPFGCQVSSITFLTGVVSITSTLLSVELMVLLAWAVKSKLWRKLPRFIPNFQRWKRMERQVDHADSITGGETNGSNGRSHRSWAAMSNLWWRRRKDNHTCAIESRIRADDRDERDETSLLLP